MCTLKHNKSLLKRNLKLKLTLRALLKINISLLLYNLQVQFFLKKIPLIFEVHYKCVFSTIKHTFPPQGKRFFFHNNESLQEFRLWCDFIFMVFICMWVHPDDFEIFILYVQDIEDSSNAFFLIRCDSTCNLWSKLSCLAALLICFHESN